MSYKMYIKEVMKYPLLSAEKEKELSKKILNGDEKARELLINSNLRYVVSIAMHYTSSESVLMDAIQEGNIGLMIAASKFDFSFNTRFITYAHAWVTQYILRHINLREPSIALPALKYEKLKAIRVATDELSSKLGRKPNITELSIYTGTSEEELEKLKGIDYKVCSIDSQTDDENSMGPLAFLADKSADPINSIIDDSNRKEYFMLINKLPEKERYVMTYRYNSFIDGSKVTFKTMGSKLGVSIEATRQIERRARNKLKGLFENHYETIKATKMYI